MYKVYLVDDEQLALIGIKKTFLWNEYGFEVIGDTTDSTEAIEEILKLKPDVVFTDIKMDVVTGLDLIKYLRRKKVSAEFVVVSGYADFTYAQDAIKYDVFDYCLKPIMQNNANDILKRLKKALDVKNGVYEADEQDDTENEFDQDILRDIENVRFKNMIIFIHNNYMDRLYLGELSEKFKLNSNYCCHLFKKYFNCNFSDYITQIRMKKASELLKNSDLSVDDIARKIGYEDYYYFNKVFKSCFGVTPYKYKSSVNYSG